MAGSAVKPHVGVLALQGCVEPHAQALRSLDCEVTYVREPIDFAAIDRLILPGGESTTMLRLIDLNQLERPLINFAQTKPVWGVCAGAILMAKEVQNPQQQSFGLIDILAERNHYGSQLDSFSAQIEIAPLGCAVEVDFIRAPSLKPLSSAVEVLASYKSEAVLLRQLRHMASSFHIELRPDTSLHKYFLSL